MTPEKAYFKCLHEKRRIPELENVVAADSKYSYWYACDVIKGPFHLCHPVIFNSEYKDKYVNFLKFINYDISKYGEWLI